MLYRASVIALLSGAVFGLWRQGAFEPWMPGPTSQRAQVLEGRLATIEEALRLQSAALGQAMGKVSPLQMAQAAEQELAALEKTVATQAAWPSSAAQVQALNNRLLELLKPLPPWAQDELLPRLLPLKWSIHTLWILRSELPADRSELVNFDTNLQAHLDPVPDGVGPLLRTALQQHAGKVRERLRAATLAEARQTIAAPKPAGSEDDRRLEKAAALLGSLPGADDEESRKLRKDLEALALTQAADKSLKDAQAQRALAGRAADAALAEHALQQARQGLMDLRLRFAALQPPPAGELAAVAQRAAEETKAIDDALRKRHADRVQRYQSQALRALKQVKPLGAMDFGEEKKKALAAQLIALAWVDRGLLDPAVADWFNTVYAEAFKQLDSPRKEQVVEAFAITPKRGLE